MHQEGNIERDITVEITAKMSVPVRLNKSMTEVLGDDPAMQAEILKEAVQLALSERLCGFSDFTITGATTFDATTKVGCSMNLAGLEKGMKAMVQSFDATMDAVGAMEKELSAVKALAEVQESTSPAEDLAALRAAVKRLVESYAAASESMAPTAADATAPTSTHVDPARGDDASESEEEEDNFDDEDPVAYRKRMGYQELQCDSEAKGLLGGGDDDDDDDDAERPGLEQADTPDS